MTPDEYCQRRVAPRGSSLYYSTLFLEPYKRRALIAVHAFCQEVRDVVTTTADENAARIKLAWWRQEVGELFKGNPQHLVTRALAIYLTPCGVPRQPLDDFVDAMEMDLLQTRYLDFVGLERYCHLAAGIVGSCTTEILGRTQDATLEYGRHLGIALQLTQIIRDVGEHARRGRVYLPVSELQQFNVPVADILSARHSRNFELLMEFQYARARGLYDQAARTLPVVDRKSQRAGLILATLYGTLLEELRADRFQVLQRRTSLTPIRKFWLAWKTWVMR